MCVRGNSSSISERALFLESCAIMPTILVPTADEVKEDWRHRKSVPRKLPSCVDGLSIKKGKKPARCRLKHIHTHCIWLSYAHNTGKHFDLSSNKWAAHIYIWFPLIDDRNVERNSLPAKKRGMQTCYNVLENVVTHSRDNAILDAGQLTPKQFIMWSKLLIRIHKSNFSTKNFEKYLKSEN